jgi:hypothetical protein
VTVLPLALPARTPVTLQANVGVGQPLDWRRSQLRLLASYRINAMVGGLGFRAASRPERYRELVALALDEVGFRQVRLPRPDRLSHHRGFADLHGEGDAAWERWAEGLCAFLETLRPVLEEPAWKGRFTLKLWDEPTTDQYAEVRRSHELARRCRDDLPLELTEEPAAALEGVVDIWVPHLGAFRPEDVREVHARGESIWLYANSWHQIDKPPHALRAVGWTLWRFGLDGYHFWSVNWPGADPWTTVSSRSSDRWKSGNLIYLEPGSGRPVPSLRLEAFRDGIEDLLLLRRLEQRAAGESDREARRLLREIRAALAEWDTCHDDPPPDLSRWRERLLGVLVEDERFPVLP